MSGVFHLDFPQRGQIQQSIENLHSLTSRATSPNETAAVIIEPILGEGGVIQLDYDFAQYLNGWCSDNNVMLICDEVQSGCGRTGDWWAYSDLDLEPDIITFAKGIASGYPLAGITAPKSYFKNIQSNGLGGTYNGNAVSIAAANATIDIVSPMLSDIKHRGRYFGDSLRKLNHSLIKEVRDYGLMIGVELDLPVDEFQYRLYRAHDHGIIMLSTGLDSTLRLLPPLTISKDEIDLAVYSIVDWLDSY
jgi:4-aminobutyrate aminotransferase